MSDHEANDLVKDEMHEIQTRPAFKPSQLISGEGHWHQGSWVDVRNRTDCAYCLEGALLGLDMRVRQIYWDRAIEYLTKYWPQRQFPEFYQSGRFHIPSWNDHPERKYSDIAKLLHRIEKEPA